MTKKQTNQEKNSLYKAFSRVFFLFLIISIAQFSMISATTWTRTTDYNPEDIREVTFKNWFGLGSRGRN
jgi:hypothetical protein